MLPRIKSTAKKERSFSLYLFQVFCVFVFQRNFINQCCRKCKRETRRKIINNVQLWMYCFSLFVECCERDARNVDMSWQFFISADVSSGNVCTFVFFFFYCFFFNTWTEQINWYLMLGYPFFDINKFCLVYRILIF